MIKEKIIHYLCALKDTVVNCYRSAKSYSRSLGSKINKKQKNLPKPSDISVINVKIKKVVVKKNEN